MKDIIIIFVIFSILEYFPLILGNHLTSIWLFVLSFLFEKLSNISFHEWSWANCNEHVAKCICKYGYILSQFTRIKRVSPPSKRSPACHNSCLFTRISSLPIISMSDEPWTLSALRAALKFGKLLSKTVAKLIKTWNK